MNASALAAVVVGVVSLSGSPRSPLQAQSSGDPSRAEAPLVLRLPASARLAAMANAGLAANDGDALLYNPGMLNGARGTAISLQRYGSFGRAGSMGTVTQIGSLNLGIGAQFVDWSAPSGTAWGDAVRAGATRLADSGGVAASSSACLLYTSPSPRD